MEERIARGGAAFLPRFLPPWAAGATGAVARETDGSLVMFDISGFTRLTERLSGQGRAGAEELSDVLHDVFSPLVAAAEAEGADLLKWGGDAVLLLVEGVDHTTRAVRATHRMQRVMASVGHLTTSVGRVVLRASSGIQSGPIHLALVGDPAIHRELIVIGPTASDVCRLDSAADAGQIMLGLGAADRLDPRLVGAAKGPGRLLATAPSGSTGVSAGMQPRKDIAGSLVDSLLPPQLRAYLALGDHEPEHRTVSAAFLRFDGTDELLDEQGLDKLTAAVDELVRVIQDETARHGITFHESDVDVDGGKFMLLGGAPLSTGDDVEHLLAAVRAILDRTGEIPVRAGVTHGRVFTGPLGPESRRTYSVKGNAVNLAARLASKAHAGEMLVPAALLAASRREYAVLRHEALVLKGVKQPVDAVSVGSAQADRFDPGEGHPLVGRDEEVAVLEAALAALDPATGTGKGIAIELVGEPGLGKSRLVSAALAAADGHPVLRVAADHSGAAATYGIVRELLSQALTLGLPEYDGPSPVGPALTRLVLASAPELAPRLHLLQAVLDLGLVMPEATTIDEEFLADALQHVVVEVLAVLLASATATTKDSRPGALLVVDDTHLVDPASAAVLDKLAAATDRMSWLLLTTRRDGSGGWHSPGTRLGVGPLPPAAARALAESLMPDRPLPPATLDTIVARAGGHPLFLQELVSAAARGDSLGELPESVEALVAVQLDGLAPADRSLLRRAAVLGDTFDVELFARLVDGDVADIEQTLQRLDRFVDLSGEGAEFRHVVHREVAYAGLAFRNRVQLHARAARLLEDDPATVSDRPELLAWHFLAGAEYPSAWQYARAAGRRAIGMYSPPAAAEAFQRAAEAGRRATTVTAAEVASDLESLGDALFLCGRPEEADRAYAESSHATARPPVAAAGLALKRAKIAHRQGRHRMALSRITTGLGLVALGTDPDVLASRAGLLVRRAVVRLSQGRYADARAAALDAIAVAKVAGDDDALAQAHLALHSVSVVSGTPDLAHHGETALGLFTASGDLAGQAHAWNNLAFRRSLEGHWSESLTMFRRAAETFRLIGDAANEANAAYNEADLSNRQGHYSEAAAVLDGVLRVARAVGDTELVGLVLRELGRALSRDGRVEGIALLRESREVLVGLGEPHEVTDTDVALAEAELLAGSPERALAITAEALAQARLLGATTLIPSGHRVRAAALVELGRLQAAADELAQGLRLSEAPEMAHERGFLEVIEERRAELAAQSTGGVVVPLPRRARDTLAGLGVVRVPVPWPVPGLGGEPVPGLGGEPVGITGGST